MTITLVVERIEGKWAILETQKGDSFEFPRDLLPKSISDGTHLRFTIETDIEVGKTAQANMKTLRDSLKNG